MGLDRIELTGFSDGLVDQLKALGLVSEIIARRLRLFVLNDLSSGPPIMGALLRRHPIAAVRARAA